MRTFLIAVALTLLASGTVGATPLASATAATHATYAQCSHCYLLRSRR